MSTPNVPLKSTQIVAGVAVVLALLGGAYAVGRSQGTSTEPVADAAPQAAVVQQQDAQQKQEPREEVVEPRKSQRVAAAEAPAPREHQAPRQQASRSDDNSSSGALCEGCARVTDVHAETLKGQGSGVGAVGGAVVGGLLGNMIGGGTGRKLATVGGAVAGGYAGNEIEKNQKSHTVWIVQVQERDGRTHRYERSADPGLRVGDQVRLTENGFTRV